MADIALQQGAGWSPYGALASDDREILVTNSGATFRGTTPTFRDIEADLSDGLNTAIPFEKLGMKPLLPARDTIPVGNVYDAKHRWFVLAWLALPFFLPLWLSFRDRTRNWTSRVYWPAALGALGFGFVLCNRIVAIARSSETAQAPTPLLRTVEIGMKLAAGAAGAACIAALLIASWRGLRSLYNRLSKARLSKTATIIWLRVALMACALGIFAKAAIWLGWYTYDTRVNLLEPLAAQASKVALVLIVIAAIQTSYAWHGRWFRCWRKSLIGATVFVIFGASLTLFTPLPPRLSSWTGQGMYVLTTAGDLVEYGDWEASVRAGLPRFNHMMYPDPEARLKEASEMSAKILKDGKGGSRNLVQMVVFNSANEYAHLFDYPILQAGLLVLNIGLLAFLAVSVFWLLATLASAIPAAVTERQWSHVVGLAFILATTGSFAFRTARLTHDALRAHSILSVLVHARGPLLQPALDCTLSYYNDTDTALKRPRWETVKELYDNFEGEFRRLLDLEERSLKQIGSYGATDDLVFAQKDDLQRRLTLTGSAQTARACLFALCESFPSELRNRMTRAKVPGYLIDSAEASWTRELNSIRSANLARVQRLNAETNLLYWLATVRDRWAVGSPGTLPVFMDAQLFAQFLERLSIVIDLKEADLAQTALMSGRLTWKSEDFSNRSKEALDFIAIQRRLIACVEDPKDYDLNWPGQAIDFKRPQLATLFQAAQEQAQAYLVKMPGGTQTTTAATTPSDDDAEDADMDGENAPNRERPSLEAAQEVRARFIQAARLRDTETIVTLLMEELRNPNSRDELLTALRNKIIPVFADAKISIEKIDEEGINDDGIPCVIIAGAAEKSGKKRLWGIAVILENGKAVISHISTR